MNNNDLISRAAAIDAALDGADDWDGGYNPERERYIREHMAKVSAVDAVLVKHGHWQEYHTKARGYGKVWYQHECTPILYESPYYYCPNCGAKMDEKREVVL